MASKSLKAKIRWYELGQRRCPCCGVQLVYQDGQPNTATFEHLVPRSHKGTFHPINGLIVCCRCNQKRGNRCWIRWVNEHNMAKKEWLIEKYLKAVLYYHEEGRRIQIRKKVINYAIRELTYKGVD